MNNAQSRRSVGWTAAAVAAVAAVSGMAGLLLGLLVDGGQPVVLATLLAILGGVEYAFLAWREERQRREAAERYRAREDLVATVSHELRTPLAPIRGWASTLLECGDSLGDDERRLGLEAILRHSRRLEELVVNLLEASKVGSGTSRDADAEVDVCTLARRVIGEFQVAWPDRRIEFHDVDERHAAAGAERVLALGSELWIEQILSNLLSNALKYAPPDLPIEVEVRSTDGDVEVSVVDHGPGIPAARADDAFRRFERLDAGDDTPGSGLGLYIAKQLAAEIGAQLSVTDATGGGAKFTLALRASRRLLVLQ